MLFHKISFWKHFAKSFVIFFQWMIWVIAMLCVTMINIKIQHSEMSLLASGNLFKFNNRNCRKKLKNMFSVIKKDTRPMSVISLWCLYCWLRTYFTPFFWCLLLTLNNYLMAEIELLMCNCNEDCLKRTPTGPKQGTCCRKCPFQKGIYFREGLLGIRSK